MKKNIGNNIKKMLIVLMLLMLATLLPIFEKNVVIAYSEVPKSISSISMGNKYKANLNSLENNSFLYCNDVNNTEVWASSPSEYCDYKVTGAVYVDTTANPIITTQGTVPSYGKTNAIEIARTLANQKLNETNTNNLRKSVERLIDDDKVKELKTNGTFNNWLYYVFLYPEQVAMWELHGQDGISKYNDSVDYINNNNLYTGGLTDLGPYLAFVYIGLSPALGDDGLTETDYQNRTSIKVDESATPKTNYNISDSGIKDKIKDFPTGQNVENYIAVGPYKYNASKGDYIEKIEVKKNGEGRYISLNRSNTDIIVLARTKTGNYSPIYTNASEILYEYEIGNDIETEFYILVKKSSTVTSIEDLKIIIGRMDLKAKWYYLEGDRTSTSKKPQRLLIGEGKYEEKLVPLNFDVTLIPPVQVELNKVDTIGSAVKGAEFKIEYSNGLTGGTATSNSSGEVKFPQVQPAGPEEFTATITETSTPAGYKSLEKPIKLKFTYNESSAEWKVTKIENESDENAGTPSVTNSSGTNVVNLKVTNKSIIEKLTLLKTSTVTELGAVKGAQFKLTLTNVASIKGYTLPTIGETKTIIVTTNSSGQIVLEDIEIADLNKEITITMEETYAPIGYKKIEGTITLTLKRQGNTYTVAETKTEGNVLENEFESGKVTLTNHELTLNIKDIPIMNLGGIVWVEKEKTGKTPTSSDIYGDGNEEEALGGVTVKLYKGTKEIATTTSSDGNATATYKNNKGESITVTLKQGEYMFTDIEAGNDYHVEFEYDGILYKALLNTNAYTTTKDSKIKVEPNRDDFNKATTTISGSGEVDKSTTNNGWTIEYDTKSQSNKALYTGVYEGTTQQFVKAKTDTYLKETKDWLNTWNNDGTINTSHYAFNINCGLCEKYFDLNLGTDVASATVKINGQETTYTYDQILDGKLNEALNKSSDSSVDYNLYLAYSDYYYRIDDYKVPSDAGTLGESYGEVVPKENINSAKADTELEIYVTYKLVLNNQSSHNATVDLVEYKYDEHYEFLQENNTNIKLAEGTNLENRVLMINTSDLKLENGGQQSIELTFKVLPDGENKCKLGTEYLNQAEIVKYSTEEGGLVDADSAPGNAFLTSNVRYEDDTDEANGIEITFKEEAERSISGKVFDDDKDSKDAVNDVIVQLIELIEINGKQYEYIWQETVAGKETVKTTATSDKNGGKGNPYTVEKGTGEYKFTQGIIPGDYIVRFIYGDGSTYDLTGNVKTYNGEDYKSTYVDYNYNAEWYNTETLNGEKSKAVDNEARRLKVMSYAVDVNGELGAKLALLDDENITGENKEGLKNVLSNTWMCAETLKIKMTVDTDNQETISDTATVANGTSPTTQNTQFTNVNFGLMKRPQTKLVLEKHITGLTIKPVASGVSLIANATVDIDKILELNEGDQIKTLEGQRDGLSATKSGRNQRAMWYLQTDTTELAQGADAYITYTYVVKNEGDGDYLSAGLVGLYESLNADQYKGKLEEFENGVKSAKKENTSEKYKKEEQYKNGTYISEFYYTGKKGTNDQEVLASVEEIQEALNPKVKFVDSTTDFNVSKETVNKKVYPQSGSDEKTDETINETITTKTGTTKLKIRENDTSKKLVVSVGLSASEIENGGVFDSYIAEVTHYTNAAGRRDRSTPENLSYVHSYDTNKTLANNNEEDEFWAETFRITKPTGEDKLTPVQIAIITITSVAVLGIGIILIKKFVLKK